MDLYMIPVPNPQWTKLCGGNVGTDNDESCVEIATVPEENLILVRDSKRQDLTPLRFTAEEIVAFANRYTA